MFGAPVGNLCVNEPKGEEVVVKETFVGSDEQPTINSETTLGDLCTLKEAGDEAAAMAKAKESMPAEQESMPAEEKVEKSMPAEQESTSAEQESTSAEEKVEEFGNRVVFGQRFLSLDLALRAVLYALLFYIVSHKDTQALLKGVVKVLPKAVKPFTPMVLFGLLYYVLNLFI